MIDLRLAETRQNILTLLILI